MLAVTVLMGLWSLGVAPGASAQTPPAITSPPPPNANVGDLYAHQFTSTPQVPPASFAVTEGSLPPGITLGPGGIVAGAATMAGTFGPTTVCASNGVTAPACQTFTITIGKRNPSIIATSSVGGVVGTPVRDVASIVFSYVPTGSVTFRLYDDEACTSEVFSSTKVVDVTGAAISDDFVPSAPGVYRWTVSYSGDANNQPAFLGCNPLNQVVILGGTTTTTSSTTSTMPTSTTSTSTTSTTVVPPTSTSTVTSSSTSTSSTTSTSTSTTSSTVPTGTTSSSTSSSTTSSTSTSTPSTSTSTSTSTTLPGTTSTTGPATTSTTGPVTTTTSTTVPEPTTTSTSTTTSTTVPATTTTTALATTTSTVPATTSTSTTGPATTSTSTTSPSTSSTSTSSTSTPSPSTSSTSTSSTSTSSPTTSTSAPPGTTTTTVDSGAPGAPTIEATPQQVVPGESVTVTGRDFPPASPVQAELFSTPVLLGTTATDAAGAFRLVVTVPLDTSPGLHTLRVSVVGGTAVAETTLSVSARATTIQTVAGSLSRTGTDATTSAKVAGVLVVAGLVLVGLSWSGRVPVLARHRRWP